MTRIAAEIRRNGAKKSTKMVKKCGKYHYRVDELRSLLSPKDQAEFDKLCRWNASYSTIRSWLAERGHKISLNALHHWWRATQPDLDEIKILNALVEQVDVKDFHRLHGTALKLAVLATRILDEHLSGKLASADPKVLMETHKELFTHALDLAKSSRGGAN